MSMFSLDDIVKSIINHQDPDSSAPPTPTTPTDSTDSTDPIPTNLGFGTLLFDSQTQQPEPEPESEPTYTYSQNIEDIVNTVPEPKLNYNITEIGERFTDYIKGKNILEMPKIANDMDQFTRLKNDIISSDDPDLIEEMTGLARIRVFPDNFLKDCGMFYSNSVKELIDKYPYLRQTSIMQEMIEGLSNGMYENNHIYPICLPNGDVYTHMAYDATSLLESMEQATNLVIYEKKNNPKYLISRRNWVSQGDLLGNLESLSQYKGSCIYVVEGYFDAKRINQQWSKKSVALLTSSVSRTKYNALLSLKRLGHCLIYIPDNDEAGQNEELLGCNLWDDIYCDIPRQYKDIDNYVKSKYLEAHNIDQNDPNIKNILLQNTLFDINLDIIFHEETPALALKAEKNKRI